MSKGPEPVKTAGRKGSGAEKEFVLKFAADRAGIKDWARNKGEKGMGRGAKVGRK